MNSGRPQFGLRPRRRAASTSLPAAAATTASQAAATAPPDATTARPAVERDTSDSESETDEEFVDDVDRVNISGFLQSAQHNRVKPVTRCGYEGYLRQMALWASSLEQFKHCVSESGNMKTPLDPDAMVGFTEHLKARQVNWPHHPVAGT